MLIRWIESLLIYLFNHTVRGWEEKRQKSPALPSPVPSDHIALGEVIAPETSGVADPHAGKQPSKVVTLPPDAWKRHLYILGATGSGKTNLLLHLIEADIKSQRAFCVFDLRGDLVDRILLRLADAAPPDVWRERLLLLDLRQSEAVVGFNPLLGEGDVYKRALHILGILEKLSDSWGVALEETLRNCLIALAQAGWSLLEIEPLLSNAPFRAEVLSQVTDTQVKNFFARYEQMSKANQQNATSAVLNKVTPLIALPQLRLLFGQRQSFSFRNLFDQKPGMVILISLAIDHLDEAAYLVGSLLVSAFQSAIMSRADQPEKDRVPVHLYLDEFENMATDRFESIIAEGRRFGLGLCLTHQNISQLSAKLRQGLRNNVHTQMYFMTGAIDAAELAKEISSSETKEDIRTAIMDQEVGEAYLMRRGQPSLRIRTILGSDPQVDPGLVAAIRQESLATYARPQPEVEQELLKREEYLQSLLKQASSKTKPTYEIRHGKTATFKPNASKLQPSPSSSTGVSDTTTTDTEKTDDRDAASRSRANTRPRAPATKSKATHARASTQKPGSANAAGAEPGSADPGSAQPTRGASDSTAPKRRSAKKQPDSTEPL
ncbi:MAG: type IV secretion system DNA-binding domain-containing protein [Abitibacteriaceae bacterium]|nr:type IV secretion system DNA-binding domain-containing protein [Abditibacteriaceae bacterium]